MQALLSAPKARKEDFLYRLKVPHSKLLGEDLESRTTALRSWTVLSLLDVLEKLASSSVSAARTDGTFDLLFAMERISGALTGISTLLLPVVRSHVEEAVAKRIEVRSASIPKDLDKIRVDLLAFSPAHPLPFGDQDLLRSMVKEVPLPVQLNLPARFYQVLGDSRPRGKGPRAKAPAYSRARGFSGKSDFPSRSGTSGSGV